MSTNLTIVTDFKTVFVPTNVLAKPENATSPYIPTGFFMVEKVADRVEGAAPNFEIIPVREPTVVFLSDESAFNYIEKRINELLAITSTTTNQQLDKQQAIQTVKSKTRRAVANYEFNNGINRFVFYVGIVAVDAPFSIQVLEGFYYVHEHPNAAKFFCEFVE